MLVVVDYLYQVKWQWYNVLTDLPESFGSISSEYAVYACGCSLSVPNQVAVVYVLTDLPESTNIDYTRTFL